nr:AMP-binding protein [Candidatus Borrarchaeum sp.]
MTTKPWIEYWAANVPLTLNYPKVPLYQLVKDAAEAFPNNTAYIFQNKSTSYDQLYAQIKKFATTLHTFGVKFTDKVALYLPNHEGYLISFFAVNMINNLMVFDSCRFLILFLIAVSESPTSSAIFTKEVRESFFKRSIIFWSMSSSKCRTSQPYRNCGQINISK